MFNNILVVCVGNICRSPYAEQQLKQVFPTKQISSAGIAVNKSGLANAPWYKTGIPVAQSRGVHTDSHKAKQLTAKMCHEAELILVMEQKHVSRVTAISPESQGKIIPLGKWINQEIPDPFRQSTEAFEFCYQLIDNAVESLREKL
ncbi:phosphatase [Shewanella sp. NFH-SH190041]|uniref:arsenate reductase/protein-tyrosine-phosphatase family protein n=1 Tax=Shewanella sp. NFH-SH190041 TaxID=2950245 RepID=UPI0021C28CF1|nr:hypothetical protein [Shewanella sp. NFH-SH190041]BDM62839.1 phosphatase [Shewanella sp. NFH-SH190041]